MPQKNYKAVKDLPLKKESSTDFIIKIQSNPEETTPFLLKKI